MVKETFYYTQIKRETEIGIIMVILPKEKLVWLNSTQSGFKKDNMNTIKIIKQILLQLWLLEIVILFGWMVKKIIFFDLGEY